MRGVFMVTVFLFHADPFLVPGAAISVDAFFVLSAFLITTLLVREHRHTGRIDLPRFYGRRALRLLPPLFVTVAVAAPVAWATLPALRPDVAPAARSVLLYYANFRAGRHPTGMAVFLPNWSLATEEQFYAVWGLVLVTLLRLRRSSTTLLLLVGGLLLLSTAWLQYAHDDGTPVSELLYRPDLRVAGILVGTLVGLAHGYGRLPDGPTARRVLPLLTTAAVAWTVIFLRWPRVAPAGSRVTLAIVFACLGFGVIVAQQVTHPLRPLSLLLDNRPVRWVGRASYSLYLVHVPVLRVATAELHLTSPGRVVVGGALTVAVGSALHYGVERPTLRLKRRRLEPSGELTPGLPGRAQ